MSSCCPGMDCGYGIHAPTVLPAGTAPASTMSDCVTSTRCGITLVRPLERAAPMTLWSYAVTALVILGGSPLGSKGVCTLRIALASGLRRNRFEGERLK